MARNRTPHPNSLSNYENAVIPRDKLERYSLDSSHESRPYGKSSGKDKARVFQALLGFGQADWELLRNRILAELPYHEASSQYEDEFGKRYNAKLPIAGPNGKTAMVLTGWIIRPGTDYPALVTAWCIGGV